MLRLLIAVGLWLPLAGCDALGLGSEAPYGVSAFTQPDGQVVVKVEGPETYPCANVPLRVESELRADGLTATILGVGERPEICLAAIGPATWTARLPAPLPDGYPVRLRFGPRTDTYRMTQAGEGVQVDVEASSFSRLVAAR